MNVVGSIGANGFVEKIIINENCSIGAAHFKVGTLSSFKNLVHSYTENRIFAYSSICMIIANPIYDVVFKRLMQNTRIARFFIETLIEETLDDVELKPQEFVYTDEQKILAVSRYDFIATIKTNTGEHKKVLIEIQKAKNAIDLMRFRNYLGEQYKKEDEIQTEFGKIKKPLPIIAIYLLGFDLAGVESAAVKAARNYTDLLTNKIINQKSDFIERLSHDCYVVQMTRFNDNVHTRLEQLLSVFEQNNFIDANQTIKEYKYEVKDEQLRSIIDVLHYVGTDPTSRKEIDKEIEAWRTIDALSGGEQLRELQLKLEFKEKALANERNEKEALAKELTELKRKLGEN